MTSTWMTGEEIKRRDSFGHSLTGLMQGRRFRDALVYEVKYNGLSPYASSEVRVGRGRRRKPVG